jgi:hypothetical protein
MEKQRGGFTFFRSFKEVTEGLPDKDRLTLYDAIINKALDNENIVLEGFLKNLFAAIKPHLEASRKNYENGKKGAIHGKKGGRPKNPNKPNAPPSNNPIGDIKENTLILTIKGDKKWKRFSIVLLYTLEKLSRRIGTTYPYTTIIF